MSSTTAIAHLDETTGAYAYTVTTTVEIPEGLIAEILSADGTAYWAERGTYANGIATWWEQDAHRYNADGTTTRKHTATFADIAASLVALATGQIAVRSEYAETAAEMIAWANSPAAAEQGYVTDSETDDIIIQHAMFGEIVYG